MCSCSHRGDGTGAVLGQFIDPLCATTGALVQVQPRTRCSCPLFLPDRCIVGPDSAENRGTAVVAVPTVVLTSLQQWSGLRFSHRQGALDLKCGREAHFAPFFALLQFSGVERQVSVFEPSMMKSSSLSRAPRVEKDSCHFQVSEPQTVATVGVPQIQYRRSW